MAKKSKFLAENNHATGTTLNSTAPTIGSKTTTTQTTKNTTTAKQEEQTQTSGSSGKNYVMNGAILKCMLCTVPEGELFVTSNTIGLQGDLWATEADKTPENLLFNGTCRRSPFQAAPCRAVIAPDVWQEVSDITLQGNKALLEDSIIICNYGGAEITIEDHLQISVPTQLENLAETEAVPATDNKEKSIHIETKNDSFLPLGIQNIKGELENNKIEFKIKIKGGDAKKVLLQILDSANNVMYEYEETEKVTEGEHIYEWDGFDKQGIYDSTLFVGEEKLLKVKVKATYEDGDKTGEDIIKSRYKEVKWVDVKIDKNNKRVDVFLRISFRRGEIQKNARYAFQDLVKLVLDGVNFYWSRNNTKSVGKHITINGTKYQIFVNSTPTDSNAMPSIKLIHKVLNNAIDGGRSRNWVMSRIIYYNQNETNLQYKTNKKFIIKALINKDFERIDDKEFKYTSGHEIGHEILQAYGGKKHSYKHKGSSTLATQETIPISKGGFSLPLSGEIDLMIYYDKFHYVDRINNENIYNKIIASEKDVLGLIWCSKLKIK